MRRWLLVIVPAIALSAWTLSNANESPPRHPVTRAEAEALLDRTVQLAQAGDFPGLCRAVATRGRICDWLLDTARDMGTTPGAERPSVVGTSYLDDEQSPPTFVLHLRVVTGEGRVLHSDFAVHKADFDQARSPTPVYWSGVTFER